MYEAKTNFSKIMNLVEHNEEIIIARNGHAIARIIPFTDGAVPRRKIGTMRGKIKVSPDFDDPLPEDILESIYLGKL